MKAKLIVVTASAAAGLLLHAFPPAPHHLLFGTVRDEQGNPVMIAGASVVMETAGGTRLTTQVIPDLEPGANYKLTVPMDSGLTADLYKPTAMRPTAPFSLAVRIGGVHYLPIEMKGNLALLGQPSKRTRIDLTLGEDNDGDGIPDAWERAILSQMGPGKTLADVNPNDDFDGDGLSNLNEYLSGTYAFDPEDGFNLKVVRQNAGNPVLEFLAIRGRTYTIQGSTNFEEWTPVEFSVLQGGAAGDPAANYYAEDSRAIEVLAQGSTSFRFYKLMVQ